MKGREKATPCSFSYVLEDLRQQLQYAAMSARKGIFSMTFLLNFYLISRLIGKKLKNKSGALGLDLNYPHLNFETFILQYIFLAFTLIHTHRDKFSPFVRADSFILSSQKLENGQNSLLILFRTEKRISLGH